MTTNTAHPVVKTAAVHLGFIALYILLDAASYIHPLYALNITPWNPAPALGLVFILRRGVWARCLLVFTVVLSEWLVRGVEQNGAFGLVAALVQSCAYLVLGRVIARGLPPTALLDDRAVLFRLMFRVAVGSFLVSLTYIGTLFFFGLLPVSAVVSAALQFWVGDGVGIAVAFPLVWWLTSAPGRRRLKMTGGQWETAAYLTLSLACVWLAFAVWEARAFKLFYLLLLPIVWASARQGMAGAIISASFMQIAVITAVQVLDFSAVTVIELQILSLAMAASGFIIGCVVDEQKRISAELRQTLRLAAAGEMAGALAHELNQPLTALSAYAAVCETLLRQGEQGERMENAVKGVMAQSQRAGEVLRRLRDFFRTGAIRLERIALAELIRESAAACGEMARAHETALSIGALPRVYVLADPLQLQVVMQNLLRNAVEAASGPEQRAAVERVVTISVATTTGAVGVTVENTGPGLSEEQYGQLFEPHRSSKAGGLGLGLFISRAIVEAHGGKLWGELTDHGCFRFELPIAEGEET